MSFAHLWQQVPSPAPSPTVERIVVEMAERSSGVGGWNAALIAGTAAILAAGLTAVLTHAFTASRDSEAWLRQRVFEIVEALDANRKTMLDEYAKFVDAVVYNLDRESLLKMMEIHDWDQFDSAYKNYTHALGRLESLVHSGSTAQLPTRHVRTLVEAFENSVRNAPSRNIDGFPSFAYVGKVKATRDSHEKAHTRLMATLYPTFFASPLKRWNYKRKQRAA